MKITDVFVPVRSLLILAWFLILCVVAPTIAAVILLGGTGYAIYSAASDKKQSQSKGRTNGGSGSQKRPEYPC